MQADTILHRDTIIEMSEDDLTKFIEDLRSRRLRLRREYEETLVAKAMARAESVSKQLNKQMEMFNKELDRLDTLIEKIDNRATNIRALRLELEDLDGQPIDFKRIKPE